MVIDPLGVDIYPNDFHGHPNVAAFVAAGAPWHVLMMKASEGSYYPQNNPKAEQWFKAMWPLVPALSPYNYGHEIFRVAYHYFRADEEPIAQAENCLATVDAAGGFGYGDFLMIDVERAEQPAGISKQQIIDGVSRCASKFTSALGITPILYTGEYCRSFGITNHMGCGMLVTAAYGSTLPPHLYTDLGWQIVTEMPTVIGWQYEGSEGPTGPKDYPRTSPLGDGPCDITAFIVGGGGETALEFLENNAGM